jgi:hypothetical protein
VLTYTLSRCRRLGWLAITPLELTLARARVLAKATDDDKHATMVERAKAHLAVIAPERASDSMPNLSTADLSERIRRSLRRRSPHMLQKGLA